MFRKIGLKIVIIVSILLTILACAGFFVYHRIQYLDDIDFLKNYVIANKEKGLYWPGWHGLKPYSLLSSEDKENINLEICRYIKEEYFDIKNLKKLVKCEAHDVFGMESIEGRIFIYCYAAFQALNPTGDFNEGACGGNNPIILIAKNESGKYKIFDHIAPENGHFYEITVELSFPFIYWSRAKCYKVSWKDVNWVKYIK